MDEAIQKSGALARAVGRSRLDNPFLKADAMPAVTGETIEQWERKHAAWAFGWKMEDAMRPAPLAALLSRIS